MWRTVCLVATCLLGATALAQPRFEVASIRRAEPGTTGGRIQFLPGGRFSGFNVAIEFVLQQVYGVRGYQIVADEKARAVIADGFGKRYHLEAKGLETATRDQVTEMVKTLLADRLGLRVHRETRSLPAYVLVPHTGGVKGARAPADKPEGGISLVAPGWIRGKGVTMARMAEVLTSYVDRPVVDQTNLDQVIDFELTWTPLELASAPGAVDAGCPAAFKVMTDRGIKMPNSTCPHIFRAVEEQLGLRLVAQNAPVEVLVIDAIHAPTEN